MPVAIHTNVSLKGVFISLPLFDKILVFCCCNALLVLYLFWLEATSNLLCRHIFFHSEWNLLFQPDFLLACNFKKMGIVLFLFLNLLLLLLFCSKYSGQFLLCFLQCILWILLLYQSLWFIWNQLLIYISIVNFLLFSCV